MAKIQNTNTQCRQGYGATGTLIPWWRECNGTATLEDSLAFAYKVTHRLPQEPTIALLGICPSKLKIYVHTKTCTHMHLSLVALFIIAKTWK